MKEMGITPFVFGDYTRFIPFYIYSMLTSYPDYGIKVFMQGKLSKQENRCLELLERRFPDTFEIRTNFMHKNELSPANQRSLIKSKKALRWLIPHREVMHFQNIYIGDVDFLIVKESPGILEAHLEHCTTTGLPYSNAIRPGTQRLTGLHFIRTKEYYDKMTPVIKYYRSHLGELCDMVTKGNSDEVFLYRMVEQGIGFTGLDQMHYRPHHGFHLGKVVRGEIKAGYLGYNQPADEYWDSSTFAVITPQLMNYFDDPLFLDMLELIPHERVLPLGRILFGERIGGRLRKLLALLD
ncbi:hypothetical protein PA598K_06804 [Paenibacillus sp. 598K]|uniref:hypothetical protein n=1 Tax=Paenibacillus sp. 598K TaxID=1117987 RepID=UPI000FFAD79B|nr:hypothetical protein [Paenibacillus sp. 598K]GBF78193.1 hypothetical protein PA598K_06804 [Paenibacillus sp. 598K]